MESPKCSLPALREVSGFSQASRQFGFPASVRRGACLGYSSMGYEISEIAMNKWDAVEFSLIRLEGAGAERHDVPERNVA